MPAQNNGVYLPEKQRTRNNIQLAASDEEIAAIMKLKPEDITMSEMLRAAIEMYLGAKIFRNRIECMRRCKK